MHHITVIFFAILCSAVLQTFSAEFADDAILNSFISPDGASAGDFEVFGDSSGHLAEDFLDLESGTSDISFDPGLNANGKGLEALAATFALDGCSDYNDQQLGKRIRVREVPALCPVKPKTFSDPQTNSDGNFNGNGNGNDNDDLIFKNNDGFETEPKNSLGLNRYGTNSDGTICPPDMWLLCSSVGSDLEGSCLGCYPCEFLGFAFTSISHRKKPSWLILHPDLFIYYLALVHCEHPRRVLCCEEYNFIVSI